MKIKQKANKELQKTIDKILGRDRDDIQDILEEMKDTRIRVILEKLEKKCKDVIDDLYKRSF